MFFAKIFIRNNELETIGKNFNNRDSRSLYFYYQSCNGCILCLINDSAMARLKEMKKWFSTSVAITFNHEEKILEFVISEISNDFFNKFKCKMEIINYEIMPFEEDQLYAGEDFCELGSCQFLEPWRRTSDHFRQNFYIDTMPPSYYSKSDIVEMAKNISSDLICEFNRIDDNKNIKEYCGIPVLYIMQGADDENDNFNTVRLLTRYLYLSNRLLNQYVYRLNKYEYASDLQPYNGSSIYISNINFKAQISKSAFMFENSFNTNQIINLVSAYKENTQFIIGTNNEDETELMCKELSIIGLKIIVIKEDKLNYEESCEYLKSLLDLNNKPNLYNDLIDYCEINDKQNRKWIMRELYESFKNFMTSKAYTELFPVYKEVNNFKISEESLNDNILDTMIGLKNVKNTINKIVATEIFNKYLFDCHNVFVNMFKSFHMVFTGNPGTAKSTVAHSLSNILYNNKIIRNNTIISVGRSDLVGQYIGWTARIVADKIREANGGILFIDEAYSLIDSNYGQEAINTLVKNMDECDTIIIFAGYPKEMDNFIKSNPGMASRIKYFVDFPDYNLDELIDILKLKVKERNLILSKGAIETATKKIKTAMMSSDFGNGRFIRNLVEKAIENHAVRLVGKMNSISKKQLLTLTKADFENIDIDRIKLNTKSIGF